MQTAVACARLLNFSRAFINSVCKYETSSLRPHSDANLEWKQKESLCSNIENSAELKKLKLISGISGIPKDPSVIRQNPCQFGDDSCFTVSHTKADILGVADGVGGWRNYGIDPGVFSDELMRACERLARAGSFAASQPSLLLSAAFTQLMESKRPVTGSSTACVLLLARESSRLHAANIGDSGFIVMRDDQVLLRSEEQQHYFNTPYQLSNAPPGQDRQVLSDKPECAVSSEVDVQGGDVILLGTDGVFDNVPDSMLQERMQAVYGCRDRMTLQRAANAIALLARSLANDDTYMSPFSRNARAHGFNTIGGKPDDITVILATVVTS